MPTTISASTTLPVNPPSSTSISSTSTPIPTLTPEQLWTGLIRKCLRPEDFIPAILKSEVLRQSESEIVRRVVFKKGEGPPGNGDGDGWVEERIALEDGVSATFTLPNGSTIQNLISVGPSGELYLTFTYNWIYDDLELGSGDELEKRGLEEVVAERKRGLEEGGLKTVRGTVEVVRGFFG
ncbi:hypothetical protein MMC14_004904 [Varicellaria rhodocarpa]|nr:hypothetical protein [Varicellaria rhodocarpa]